MTLITRAPRVSLLSGVVLAMAMTATIAAAPGTDSVLTISGELTYRARIALPPDSLAILELIDPSVPGGRVISERRVPLEGRQVPIPIDLSLDPAELSPHQIHEARGAILSQGLILWVMEPVAIAAASGAVELGPILMRRHEPIELTNALVCGEQPIRVGFRDGEMRLQVGDQAFDLRQAVSASGARYVALADPQTWVWIKGERATLQLAGQTSPECTPVATGPSTLRATGNAPAWSLEIDNTHVLLLTDLGETRIRVALTDPEPVAGGIRYDNLVEDGELTITLLDRICRDSMSGMPHPKTVKISLDGVALDGCGGDPASLLQGDEWVVEDIAGGGIIDRSRVTLDFGAEGALSGGGSCNRYHSHYALTGEGLTIAQPASTMMACAPALMHQEQVFFELLARTTRFELDADGALRLHTADGRSLLARRGTP